MHSPSQAHGVAAADIKKLTEGGIYTVETLAHCSKKELLLIKGLSEAKIEKLQKEGKSAHHYVQSSSLRSYLVHTRPVYVSFFLFLPVDSRLCSLGTGRRHGHLCNSADKESRGSSRAVPTHLNRMDALSPTSFNALQHWYD